MPLAPDLAFGSRVAIVEPGRGQTTYAELESLTAAAAQKLTRAGVRRGDRVGLYARRSVDVVAAMLGALRIGAVYVPVDPNAPAARNAGIHADCGVRFTLIEARYAAGYRTALDGLDHRLALGCLDTLGLGAGLRGWLDGEIDELPPAAPAEREDLAYILYTSGSTGRPKGVSITHESAAVFVRWARDILRPVPDDRFANHAQFHFDLSVLDIYASLASGAALVLVPDEVGKHAASAVELIARERISIWYSAPHILAQIAQLGFVSEYDLSALRVVAFAGEVFPIAQLKSLKGQLPHPRYLNLYGPTETNVCTFYELPAVLDDFVRPVPIGKPCA
ncbi:MAG TPA: AMP-binding protein, partial [Polyangiaceae bacterium]|nr:AMP-binding protein [Polyangiaceae bacterium]